MCTVFIPLITRIEAPPVRHQPIGQKLARLLQERLRFLRERHIGRRTLAISWRSPPQFAVQGRRLETFQANSRTLSDRKLTASSPAAGLTRRHRAIPDIGFNMRLTRDVIGRVSPKYCGAGDVRAFTKIDRNTRAIPLICQSRAGAVRRRSHSGRGHEAAG